MPRSWVLSSRIGGFLGRVSRVFSLPLQGVYVVLDRRIFGTRGKSAFVTSRANACERRGVSQARAGL